VGAARIGLAACDPSALLATPVETVANDGRAVERILQVARDLAAIELVVGFPVSLSGRAGPAAEHAHVFARSLADAAAAAGVPVSVRLVDERLSTVSAERVLRDLGRKGARRRAVVDQAAAAVILQHAVDMERSTGQPPGQEVGPAS
jgi:putative holliday junction resolvase